MISEAKMADLFQRGQFLVKGFSELNSFDWNVYWGERLFFIRKHVPANVLSRKTSIENVFVELKLNNG